MTDKDAYKIFRELEERNKRANPYKFYDKDELIDEILKDEDEIERLNKELETLKQPQVFIDTQDMEERYGEELYKEYLEKENKRLNNIINELEKGIKENIEELEEHQLSRDRIDEDKEILRFLQELKGSE